MSDSNIPAAEPEQPAAYAAAGAPAPAPSKKGMSIASLVLGILGFISSWAAFGGLLGLIAVILGAVGLKKEPAGKGMSIAGIVLGALALIGGIIALIVYITVGAFFMTFANEIIAQCGSAGGRIVGGQIVCD